MFFIISKLVYGLMMPISLIVIAFILALAFKNKNLKTYSFYSGIGLLLFFTNPFIANIAIRNWELEPIEYSSITNNYEFGVLLTGITDPSKTPTDRVHFYKGADRLIHTLELYRRGVIQKIIISGGSGSLVNKDISESINLKSVLLLANVPEDAIFIENKARNTHENAQYTKLLLKQLETDEKVLLITSAFHLRRAIGCFEKAKIDFDYFPTDYYRKPISFIPDELIIPNVDALKTWTILFKEWIGYIAYFLAGYV